LTKPHGLFISYRREQTAAHAGRIYDRLSEAFGEEAVFMDVDSIGLGLDFARVLDDAVSSCEVMLVLIGPGWAEIGDEQGRRLDDPGDYVRQEIEAGLRREVRVVPLLLSGAALPRPEELPEGLRPLVSRQAFRLPDETFRSQAQVLVERLRPLVSAGALEAPAGAEPGWTAHAVHKSRMKRVLRVQLTHTQHTITFRIGFLNWSLRVDDVKIARISYRTEDGVFVEEYQFQLADGDTARPCSCLVYTDVDKVMRIALNVDGRLLYDEGEQQASPSRAGHS
jgi:hypothetical protein